MKWGLRNTTFLIRRGLEGRGGQARADRNGCDQAEPSLAGQIAFSWTLELVSHSELPAPMAVLVQTWDKRPTKHIPEAGNPSKQNGVRDLNWSSKPPPFEAIKFISSIRRVRRQRVMTCLQGEAGSLCWGQDLTFLGSG